MMFKIKQILKNTIKNTPIYHPLRNWIIKRRQIKELIEWQNSGKPVPPPHIVKQQILQEYSRLFGLKIFVETGTYFGDMIEAMKNNFHHIYSIELSSILYEQAKKRFKNENNIALICGNSGSELKYLLKIINQPALFWLDSHYSGGVTAKGDKDTPIFEELSHIFNYPDMGHVIIIDDARCFGIDPNYPRMQELKDFIKANGKNLNIVIKDDSIRITPQK